MLWLLDALAVAAVAGAVIFLLRPRKSGCAACGPAARGAETRISLSQLRQSARRPTHR